MSGEIIFCSEAYDGEGYEFFWHEADALLYALGQSVLDKTLTSEEARNIYAKHYDIADTYEIAPKDVEAEKSAILEDWEKYYGSREEVEEALEEQFGEYGNFPTNEDLDFLPNSMPFWEDADRLRLRGVGFSDDISPASGPVFLVDDEDALASLKEACEDRYRFVIFKDAMSYSDGDHEEILKLIERTRQSG